MGGGMNPKQMAQMMRQMGIKTTEVDASRVVIERADGGKIVVSEPAVSIIEFQGQKTMQVSGKMSEEAAAEGGAQEKEEGNPDVELIMQQTGATREEAEAALSESVGDIAEAILKLKKE